jgi:hypothetical protein
MTAGDVHFGDSRNNDAENVDLNDLCLPLRKAPSFFPADDRHGRNMICVEDKRLSL